MASIYGEELDNIIVANGILLARLVVQGKVDEDHLLNESRDGDNLYDDWKKSEDGLSWSDYYDTHSLGRRVWNAFTDAGGDDTHSGGSWYCVKQSAVNVLGGWIALGEQRPYTPEQARAFLAEDELNELFLATVKEDSRPDAIDPPENSSEL